MLIGNVFQQLYNTVDSIVVGQGVGKEALAAVGASFPIIFLMVSLVMGITMGSSIMLSQFFGAGETGRLKRTMYTTYIFLFVASIAITVAGLFLSGPILRAIKTPDDVLPLAKQYLAIMFSGMIFLFGYNTVSAILRGLGDSMRPLYFLVVATLLNIVLDIVFVIGFHWGVAGAAWATVIAQAVSLVISLVYTQRSKHDVLHLRLSEVKFDIGIFKTMLHIGLPTAAQQTLVSLGFVALNRIVNPFGTNVIAGYAAASRLDSFAAMPAMNLSMALSTFVGQNLGAGKPERVRRGLFATLGISSTIASVVGAVMIIFRAQLIGLFTSDPQVIRIGAQYLFIVPLFYLVFTAMFVVGGVLRGAGDTLVQMLISLVGLWIVRIPASAILSGRIGTMGLWLGIPIGWSVGLILSSIYYATGRWKTRVIAGPRASARIPVPRTPQLEDVLADREEELPVDPAVLGPADGLTLGSIDEEKI